MVHLLCSLTPELQFACSGGASFKRGGIFKAAFCITQRLRQQCLELGWMPMSCCSSQGIPQVCTITAPLAESALSSFALILQSENNSPPLKTDWGCTEQRRAPFGKTKEVIGLVKVMECGRAWCNNSWGSQAQRAWSSVRRETMAGHRA